MNVPNYGKRLVVMIAVALTMGFASFARAEGGMAMLSDSVRPVAYTQDLSGPPPSPFADPTPDTTPEAVPATAVPAESGVTDLDSGAFEGGAFIEEGSDASICDYETCNKSYVFGSELKRFVRGCPQPTGAFVRTDYLLWWTKGSYVPPLITTSTNGDVGGGVLGSPYTEVLFGNEEISFTNRSGIKVSGGFLFDCGRAIEFDYMTLGRINNGLDLNSSGNLTVGDPYLARPFYDVQQGQQSAQQIAGDEVSGRIYANQSEFFQSFGIFFRRPILCPCDPGCSDECCDDVCGDGEAFKSCQFFKAARPRAWRVDFLGGWRNYRLEEWTTVEENLVVVDQPPYIPGSTFDITDSFATENTFNGAELGLSAQLCRNRWSVDLLAKVALGSQTQIARINGQTTVNDTIDPPITYEGGILALDSNIGDYRRNKFVAIPEFGAEVSYYLTRHLRAHVGYHLIYWPEVVRSAGLIDLNVDPRQFPPPTSSGTQPAFTWSERDYWAQGLNFGLEARF